MYGTIFESLFSGSMVGSPPLAFAVWAYVLANTKPKVNRTIGVVSLHPRIIASMFSNTTEEDVAGVIKMFTEPDQESNRKEEDGRRLVWISGNNYRVVNWPYYNDLRRQSERAAYWAEWKRNKKAEKEMQSDRDNDDKSSTAPIEPPPGFPKSADMAAEAGQLVGVPPEFARTTWELANGRGGRDARDVPIRNFASHLRAQWKYKQESDAKARGNGGSSGGGGAFRGSAPKGDKLDAWGNDRSVLDLTERADDPPEIKQLREFCRTQPPMSRNEHGQYVMSKEQTKVMHWDDDHWRFKEA